MNNFLCFQCLRHHASLLCKNVGIKKLKSPKFIKLVERYTLDLCLPPLVSTYAKKLIKAIPPEFSTRAPGTFPAYEARAMAYIIFVLKLIFGLEDNKEHIISEKAKILNDKIEMINKAKEDKEKLLFVWSDWVQYIESRKTIIEFFSPSTRELTNPCSDQDNNFFVQKIDAKIKEQMEKIPTENEENCHIFNQRINCLQSIFKEMAKTFDDDTTVLIPSLSFKPSLTPFSTNLATILEFVDNCSSAKLKRMPIKIPPFIHENYRLRNMKPFVNVEGLQKFFSQNNCNLTVTEVTASNKNNYLGVFCPPHANSNDDPSMQSTDLQFNTEFKKYSAGYYRTVVQGRRKILKTEKAFSDVSLFTYYILNISYLIYHISDC